MITMSTQQYCLRWNNHQPNFISVFSSLLNSESLVDVTLSAEGRHLQAHKLVLSACSAYFQSLFTINPCQHPIVILKDVKFNDLKVIIDFMYYGEVNVSQDQLPYILKTAEMLKIKGLAEIPVEASMKQNNSDRPEVLRTDTGWGHNNDVKLRQSLSPSPCSLSPGSKRKRLRKSSTGSGSGSTERPCDDHSNNEVTLTSPLGVAIIKPDPMGFQTDSNNSQRKHHGEGEMTRGSSHESVESESPHQITLQVPQQELSVQHSVESSTPLDIPGSSTTSQQTVTGYQWGIVDHNYPHFTQATLTLPQDLQYTTAPPLSENYSSNMCASSSGPSPAESNPSQINTSPPPQVKRKRSVNPQADENFIRALEAVRFGGVGFCKAARMYGVNNRTLWLEYKKRGYPINRLSIKNRKTKEGNTSPPPANSPEVQNQQTQQQHEQHAQQQVEGNPITMISGAFIDGRPVQIATPNIQRPRIFDTGLLHTTPINLQSINFDQM